MRIDILTLLPELLKGPFDASIVKRALEKSLVEIHIHDLRSYGLGKHRQVDDYPYGGGAGMVMRIEPIERCLEKLQSERTYDEIIFMAPDGHRFSQAQANELSLKKNLIILCGHYKGVDQRVRDYLITREISIGEYVLSGGEIPAAVVTDAIVRLIPGVLGDETSALTDSFQDGLLGKSVYTRPSQYKGWGVPDILLSGDFQKIDHWCYEQSLRHTRERISKAREDTR
ncbi:tRNA (guanosine(37)-N1)-methyltransferase TrmD [Bacteroidetes bacterium endosymbiont of Geopemphigus sp.]|uniref:tRNA (guanosine(37)-N1)-methyltransferase TrmD n=1 Tax=Bacteroidetes bacterium endosymbiont of Geopemphigus sp. TaxID=2047937 RepID=UPI000CD2FD5B|nr:tRNA (guanosine(37)-N1)-methyltransferase TrmD [Bacteroidetes bacterium endosymbiont of Geopemphigus sp.]